MNTLRSRNHSLFLVAFLVLCGAAAWLLLSKSAPEELQQAAAKYNKLQSDRGDLRGEDPANKVLAVEEEADAADEPGSQVGSALRAAQSIAARPTGQAEFDVFNGWLSRYLATPEKERGAILAEGVALAEARRPVLARLIRMDPMSALDHAVPMVVRQDLPENIVALLEERVRLRAALIVNGNVPLPGQENSPDFKPYTRVVSTEEGEHWNAYVYGKRGMQSSLSSTSINGISLGFDMAVADSPVRQLEVGERPVPDGREIVESCPVSKKETVVARTDGGTLPPVSEETPAFETPERIIYVCSGGHIQQAAEEYSSEEESAHRESRGATLNAGAGSGAPIDPTSAIPGSSTTGQRSLLYIRVTFPDHLIDPQSEAECHDALRQMTDWVSQTSHGRLYYTYGVTPLIVLPYPESWYVQHQTDGASADSVLRGQAITLARAAGYDNLTYDNEVIRWNGFVGAYGGSAGVGGRNINLKTNSVGTLLHELGHNLGLWHANFWQTSPPSSIGPGSNGEYGNIFDVLGSSGSNGQFTASFKNAISWLPNETHWTVNSPGVYRIHQFDTLTQDPAYRYALRIRKDTERDYWAEFRQSLTSNTGFMNGLMLTWDRWGQGGIGGSGGNPGNGSNGGAQLLDMTPGSFGNGITDTRNDSALWVGRTFSDTDSNIHITSIAKNATTPPSMDVYVHTGDAPGNLAPTLSVSASSTTVATNASVTFTATASDPNGDPLAYAWVFNDGTYSTNNNAVQTKSWGTAGHYRVLCTASDMKGKRTTRAILVTVGSPTTFMVSGNITGPDSLPLEGVYVASHVPSNGTSHSSSSTFKGTWTDSDGNYTLTGIAAGSFTISPNLDSNVFTPSGFSNPVAVGPSATGRNFTSASLPTITINVIDAVANEGASPGTGTVRLERTGSTASALSVQIFNTNTGTATRNTDYTLSPAPTASTAGGGSGTSEYIIPAGASFLDITVTPVNDSTAEGSEYASLDFANTSGGYVLAGPAVARVEIVDDENSGLPVVRLTQLDNVASESGGDTATLLVERNGSTTANLSVNLTMTGTATNGTDYTIPASVVIPSGSATASLTLTPVDDTAQEGTETAIITITTNAAYARDSLSNSQTVTIHDNDLPVVTIAATDAILTETPGDQGVFTISRTGGDPYLPLTVDYAISGRAVHGADYRRLEGRAVIPAGASSTTVEIYPTDDSVDEGTQDVILQLRSTSTYTIGGSGTATMSITDNDGSQIYVKLTQSGVIEPASGSVTAVSYQIIRPASGSAITVNYAMSGTATSGVDYTALPGTIAFAAADTSKTISVSALADTAFEDAESVTLTLLPGTGYTLMASQNPSATGFIVDGDQPTLDVSAVNTVTNLTTAGSETSASLRFIISRDVSTASDLVVNYTMAGTSTEGVDYTGTTGSVTILANTISAYITIVPVNDTIPEGVESIVMNLTPATGTYGLRTPSATLLLSDNDSFPSGSVAFAASTTSTTEATGTHNVPVNVTGSPTGTITVSYRLSAGTATGGGYDFTLADGVLTFPQGTTTLNIPITIHPDILAEPAETIVLQLYNVSGGNLGTSTHTVTLNNQSMPEAFTDAATGLLANGVTLNGRVIPNGLATNAWFEYGPTAAYGSSTSLQAIGAGTTSLNVNAALSGFAPGGYHFRCVAQNSAGTTYGINRIVSSSNANLAALVTSVGTFSPAFDAANQSYSVTVPSGTSSVTATPTVAQANASVKVNGSTVASGTASTAIAIGSGTTTVNVLVTAQDGVTTKIYTLAVAPATGTTPQTINFAALPARSFGDAPFSLTATTSSGLPVSYSSSNPAAATVSGSTVTITGVGSAVITATQAGDSTFAAASPVAQTLVVNQASQTISLGTLATQIYGTAPFALNSTASSGLSVSYVSADPAVATVSGNMVTIIGVGTTTITASQAGNSNYNAAPDVAQVLTVNKAAQTITFAALTARADGDAPFALNATASSSLAVSYASSNLDVATVSGNTVTIVGVGNATITASQVGDTNYNAAPDIAQVLTVELVLTLTWDSNNTGSGQTNGAGAWLGANQWWDGASNQTWVSGRNAIFGGPNTAGGAITLASPTSANSISFNAFTGTYTLGTAGQALTINGGINKTSASAAVTIVSPIMMGAAQTWTNDSSGGLTLSSTLNNGGFPLTVDGSGTATMKAGIISGSGGLTKNGSGFLEIGGQFSAVSHTYTGTTTLNGGVMRVNADTGGLGNLGSGNLTLNGGVLEYYFGGTFIRTLGSGPGQVQILGGASGFGSGSSATFTLNNNAAYEAVWGSSFFNPSVLVFNATTSAGATTLANKLDLNAATRTVQVVAGTAVISGIIRTSTGTGDLVKTGNGILTLSAANTYNGSTSISGGILQIGNNSAGTLGNGTYNGNISIASGATLRVFSTANQTLGGTISGSGGLVKSYAGSLTLSNSNTYTGKTSISPQTAAGAGTVSVSSFNSVNGGSPLLAASSLGAPTTVANGTIDFGSTGAQAGAILRYTGSGETTNRVINFLFNGIGATKTLDTSGAGLLKFTGTFTGSGVATNDITLQGTSNGEITGGLPFAFRNFAKAGNGTWTLGGPVGNTGTTTISAGRLALGANQVLPNTTAVTIAAATLDAATFSDTLGTLDVTAAAVINLGSGAALAFADSSGVDWTGGTLNLTGTFVSGVTLRFGTSNTGLTSVQLAKFSGAGLSSFALNGNGYLTASGGSGDNTPPTLAASAILDDRAGAPAIVNTMVTYQISFSEDIDTSTVSAADFGNAGTSAVTIGSVTGITPGVFTVQAMPTTIGTLRPRVNAGAIIKDYAGNALNTASAIADDTVISIIPVNTAPVANSQTVSTTEDAALPITLVGTDAELDALTYTIVSQPAQGTLSGAAPNVTYTPAANYNGSDAFTFRVNDGTLNSVLATVSITVTPVNDIPLAVAQSVATDEDTAKLISLAGTDIDGDTLTYVIVTPPANGTLSGAAPNVTYTPATNYNGPDSFNFTVNDGTIHSAVATVSITLTPVNDAPVFAANPVAGSDATEDAVYAATLAGSASDVDQGATLTYAKVSGPAWLSVAPDGSLSGTPVNGDVGANSFTVSVSDSIAVAEEATLNITVINTNDAPVFAANPIAGADATEDAASTGTIAGAAADVDLGATLTYAKVSGPAWLSVAANGDLSGTPTNSDVGSNSFIVSVSDGIAPAVEATLTITVINTNDAPEFTSNPLSRPSVAATSAYSSTIAGSASDVDAGVTLTYAKVSGPAWLNVATSGMLTGTPGSGDAGANSFTVSVSDGIAPPVQATLNITVNPPPDTTAPVIASVVPADESAGVTLANSLTANFSEDMVAGTGNITVKNLTDATQSIISISDGTQVSISGTGLTINPAADLLAGKNYAIQIDAGAVTDLALNAFVGIPDDTTWNFATVPPSPVIYEPFAGAAGALSGKAGGIGLSGNWLGSATITAGSLSYGSLPAGSGNKVSIASQNGYASFGTALSSAGLLANGKELWFSVLVKTGGDIGSNGDLGFALGTDQIGTGNNLPIANSGRALGFTFKLGLLRTSLWGPGTLARSTTNSGNGANSNTSYLVAGRFTWGAASDKLEIYKVATNLTLGSVISTYTTPSNIDQSLFDTISFGAKSSSPAHNFDEIRFGGSYEAVITGQSGQQALATISDEQMWQESFTSADLSDPTADLDGDGLSNGNERVWGLDPTHAISLQPIETPLNPLTGKFRYTRRDPSLTGLAYTVWTSTNLKDWSEDDSGAIQTPGETDANGVQTVEVTLSPELIGVPSLFVQVRASN